jgi:PAS domain S-box-containing protein
MDEYALKNGQALELLSQSQNSEAKWADQAQFLETLMDVIPFPLYQKDNEGRFVSSNASFQVVFEVSKEKVAGQRNEDFLRRENAKTLAKIELDLLARDSMAVEEATLVHADGLPHNFIVYLMPFVDKAGAARGSIGVLIDITERKQREETLVQLNATKDQLFSIISHDLRGPVGKLKQLLDIYMDDPGIFDKATWDQVFHDMRRSADSLFQLLENLLSWARSQQKNDDLHYESVSLEPIVGDVFSILKLLAKDKKVALEMNIKLAGPLLTDRHVLSTILRNLVHNALKFSNPGGTILVSAAETPAELWIEVKDEGVGMSPDVLHRIFQKKERMTTFGTGKEKGQGIGLGLCRDLALSLGANLTAESALGRGTAIRLNLPTPEL